MQKRTAKSLLRNRTCKWSLSCFRLHFSVFRPFPNGQHGHSRRSQQPQQRYWHIFLWDNNGTTGTTGIRTI